MFWCIFFVIFAYKTTPSEEQDTVINTVYRGLWQNLAAPHTYGLLSQVAHPLLHPGPAYVASHSQLPAMGFIVADFESLIQIPDIRSSSLCFRRVHHGTTASKHLVLSRNFRTLKLS